jgi:hypothetical protein
MIVKTKIKEPVSGACVKAQRDKKALVPKPTDLGSILWPQNVERTDFSELSSDLHIYAMAYAHMYLCTHAQSHMHTHKINR